MLRASVVSALRRDHGLRSAGWDSELPVVGLASQTTNDRRANTMKPYILRASQTCRATKFIPSVVVASQFLPVTSFFISLTPGFSRVINVLRAKQRFQPFFRPAVVACIGQAVETASPELCSNTGLKPGANERLQETEMSHRSYLHIEIR